MTGDYEYSRSNRRNIPLLIQNQLSKKPIALKRHFNAILFRFWNLHIYIKIFNTSKNKQTKKKAKKKECDSLSIFGSQRVKLLSANPLTVNPLTFLRC